MCPTARKLVDARLKESEERYRKMFEEALDAIFVAEAETGVLVDCNRAACELVGRERSELIGKHQRILHPFVAEEDFSETFKQHLKEKAGQVLETQVVTKTGEIKDVAIKATLIEHRGKKLLQGVFRDVTEHKRMVDALRESEGRVRSILDASPDAITVIDSNGTIISCNQATVDLHGFSSKDELIGKNAFELIAKKYREEAMENLKKVLEQGSIKNVEYPLLTKDGREFPAELSASVILDAYGKSTTFVVISKDITERKEWEEQLRFNSLILDNISDSIIVMDMEGRITFWSKGASAVYGYVAEEMLGGSVVKLSKPEEQATVAPAQIERIRKGAPFTGEWEGVKKNGELVWMMLTDLPLKNSQGETIGVISVGKDITERRRVEEALRLSEGRYRTLIENLPQKIFLKDRNSVYVSCNDNYARDLKIKPDEIVGKTDYEFHPRDLAEKYRADDRRVMESGRTEELDERYIQDGREAFVRTVKTPILDREGNATGVLGIFWDITERRRLLEKLQASEEKYRILVESAADFIFMIDEQDRVLSLNRSAATLFRKKPEEVIGKSIFDLFPAETATGFSRGLKEAFRTGESKITESKMVVGGNGLWISTSLNPVRNHEGKVVAVMGVTRDVTERKHMEEALRESEEKYRALVENSPNFIYIIQEGAIRYANKDMCEELGWTFEELTAPTFNVIEELVPERFQVLVKESLAKRFRGEQIPPYEICVKTRNGAEIPVIVNAQMIPYHGKPAAEYTLVNISERKQAEAERMKVVEDVARSIAHDVRNPLSAIRTATYLLRDEVGEKGREMLELIDRNILATDNIIMNLRDLSTPPPIQPSPTNLNRLLKEVTKLTIIPENVKLSTHYGEIPQAEVDKDQLTRIFSNLVMNAVQAMPNGGELTITTTQTDNSIEIKIKDTGIGIPPENLAKLFTPFFTTKAKGTGLGLITVKRMIEAHGGTLTVESEEGKGTTITVQLPPNPQTPQK